MYVSGIEVDDEMDEEIVRMIRDHARDKNIRIMGHTVIRTKRYPYVVGCKILIPESEEYLALTPDIWGDMVECRKWEPQRSWKRWNSEGHESYSDNDKYYDRQYKW